jgi:hypothetical protein
MFGMQRRMEMHFYYEMDRTIVSSTPLGQWDLSGYREVAVHMSIKGPGGAKVYPEFYFNGLSAAQETLTVGPAGPDGWNVTILTKVYPVFAPTLGIVLYNPTAQMELKMRLYAACCGTYRATPIAIQRKRVVKKPITMEALIRGPHR